jgi:dipeptidyl aminopeptidase/acylaminoacyl peptidase
MTQHGDEPILATDLFQIRQLSDVHVAPGGRQVLYTVRSVEREGENGDRTYRTHLWLAPADGSAEPRALTRGSRSASQPAWHPDGDRIAFVRPVDGQSQIFVLPLTGGEPMQITRLRHGASTPAWSPDGRRLLFAASLSETAVRERDGGAPAWPDERPGRAPGDTGGAEPDPDGSLAEIRAWLDANAVKGRPRVLNRLNFQGELDLQPDMSFRHLYVIDAREDAEPIPVTRGFFSYQGGAWLTDEQLVVAAAPVEDAHPDRVRHSSLYVIDPDGRNFRMLLEMEGYSLSNPIPSPDGRTVAFSARDMDDPGYAQTQLGIYGIDGRTPAALLTADLDRSASAARWSADGWHLYFVAPTDGDFPLYRIAVFGDRRAEEDEETPPDEPDSDGDARPEITRLTGTGLGVRSFDTTERSVYYVRTEVANPFELYASNLAMTEERRITSHNASWLESRRVSFPGHGTVQRPTAAGDTLEIHYWIMPPAFQAEGGMYPLLLQIHGGPAAMWGPGEASMWHEFQYFAARGYGVVFSNPRGSGGYGREFQAANFQDWGTGPAGDVLATAEIAAAESWADPDRQVVTGGSYAGYLTAWIVAHDDRFQAAAAQRGVYDLHTFLGEGNAWRLVENHFGGHPWDQVIDAATGDTLSAREVLDRESPMTFVDRITTPLLIKHSDRDLRTGVIQSEMLYRSLKILERPVEYARYPGEGHDLSRIGNPELRLDRLLRIHEFLARYVE